MDTFLKTESLIWLGFVFLLGLMVGSFVNVLVARLPFEKSVIWPGSRCFSCYQPIRWTDNLPIIGYLKLGGKCATCGTPFSSRYLWVELATGLLFAALFCVEVLYPIHKFPASKSLLTGFPPRSLTVLFLYHAVLVTLLLAAALIDAAHRIIPPLIPYTGAVIGIVGGTLMPWPWPHANTSLAVLPADPIWQLSEYHGLIPIGVQPWPFWGPLPSFAPPGSWQLGLLNSVIGALAGTLVVRWVKWLFEVGFGKEALGLGDADLLLMAGAFVGWQPAVFSLFTGAFAALIVFKLPGLLAAFVRGSEVERELPFGPGLAVGVIVTLLGWRWLGPRAQMVFLDLPTLGIMVGVMSVGMLAAGLLLRRPEEATAPVPAETGAKS
jgi:leader peptidase (prepilin peptidase)/N-methyltransferase